MEIKMKYGCKNCSSKDFELITNGLKYVRVKCSECGIEREHKQPFEFINEKGNKTTFAGCVMLEENISWPDLSKRGGFLEKGAEKKMEKIVVKSREDLLRYVVCADIDMVVEKQQRISYKGVIFKSDTLRKAVKVLNALGGNFEYKEVEVIDTFTKFRKFLIDARVEFRPSETKNFRYNSVVDKYYHTHEIEEKFNVDLKILK